MTIEELNALDTGAAHEALAACCGADGWVQRMLASRPFASRASLVRASDDAWRASPADDILAAVVHHPRIGDAPAAQRGDDRSSGWSRDEQAAALSASDTVRHALAAANADYERRFGRTFIICADGRTAGDMLRALRDRLTHDPEAELATTAEELRKITALRLGKLLDES